MEFYISNLSNIYQRTKRRVINNHDHYVILSDLHLGVNDNRDGFRPNAEMFLYVLREYYLKRGYSCILNGDVEDLQRYPLDKVQHAWPRVYRLFDTIQKETELVRLIGNHDKQLLHDHREMGAIEALRLYRGDNEIFIFHGHQTSKFYEFYNHWSGALLKYLAKPFNIKSLEVAYNSKKRFYTERRVYDFSSRHKIISIIGHTHRPLFESMSKLDTLKFDIERLCRDYTQANSSRRAMIEQQIILRRDELLQIGRNYNNNHGLQSNLYRANLVVPCVFNSGCVIGKRGMTAIEIRGQFVVLVHWFDQRRMRRKVNEWGQTPRRLQHSDYFRVSVAKDNLDYIAARVRLLA